MIRPPYRWYFGEPNCWAFKASAEQAREDVYCAIMRAKGNTACVYVKDDGRKLVKCFNAESITRAFLQKEALKHTHTWDAPANLITHLNTKDPAFDFELYRKIRELALFTSPGKLPVLKAVFAICEEPLSGLRLLIGWLSDPEHSEVKTRIRKILEDRVLENTP